jgi:hypothetical protein
LYSAQRFSSGDLIRSASVGSGTEHLYISTTELEGIWGLVSEIYLRDEMLSGEGEDVDQFDAVTVSGTGFCLPLRRYNSGS